MDNKKKCLSSGGGGGGVSGLKFLNEGWSWGSGDGVAVYTNLYRGGGGGEGLKAVLNKGWSLEGVHLH